MNKTGNPILRTPIIFVIRECIYGNNWEIGFGINFNHSFDGGYAYAAIDSLKVHRYTVNYNIPSSYKRDLLSSYLNLKKKWQRLAFNTVTSYSRTQDRQMLDADFTYLDVFDNGKNPGRTY